MGENVKKSSNYVGYWFCNLAFVLERFSFYSAKWLIAQFVAAKVMEGGIGLDDAQGAIATANLVAWTYAAPIFGSIISDRFVGAKYLVPIGMAFMSAGYFIGVGATNIVSVNLMIILVAIGTGLFKPQTNSITGRLFSDKDKLDQAFSTQYSMVNVGSFIGTTIIGILAGQQGYRICFLICAIIMLINAVCFTVGWKFLGETGKRPFKFDENQVKTTKVQTDNKPLTALEKKRVAAIVIVSAFSAIFWVFWYLAYMPVYYHWGDEETVRMLWQIGNFKIPTAFFDSENALLCIVLGPVLGFLWTKLRKRPQGGFSIFKHTSLGIIILGLSFVVFALAEVVRGQGTASILWVIVFGILLSTGEMVFSPLGNSFISKYAPAKLLSLMMAVWTLAVFVAGQSYGYIYAAISKLPFANTYFTIAGLLIVAGVILLMFDKKLSALVTEE